MEWWAAAVVAGGRGGTPCGASILVGWEGRCFGLATAIQTGGSAILLLHWDIGGSCSQRCTLGQATPLFPVHSLKDDPSMGRGHLNKVIVTIANKMMNHIYM